MKKESIIRKADELFENILPNQRKVRELSERYLKKVLEEHDGCIDFDDYPVPEGICVSYDGGNHPEYASNCFSTVYGVFLDENDDISFNIEDCSDYPIENLNWDEVYAVADYINTKILPSKK